MRISDWSSDVGSSDLSHARDRTKHCHSHDHDDAHSAAKPAAEALGEVHQTPGEAAVDHEVASEDVERNSDQDDSRDIAESGRHQELPQAIIPHETGNGAGRERA